MSSRQRLSIFSLILIVGLLALACRGGSVADTAPVTAGRAAPGGKITVFAAASLTDSFKEISAEFKRRYPGSDVEFQFAGSPALRTQIEQGARADVYASADEVNMEQALKAGLVRDDVKVFASNSLVIITPRSNPGKVSAPLDLGKRGLKLVLAAPEVPAGNYARQAFALMAGDSAYGAGFEDAVLGNVVSNQSNVKQVVAMVQLGEADAGVVYATDVTPDLAGDLAVVRIPAAVNIVAQYPIAVTKSAGNPALAEAFVAFVTGPEGQAVLKKYGFQSPI